MRILPGARASHAPPCAPDRVWINPASASDAMIRRTTTALAPMLAASSREGAARSAESAFPWARRTMMCTAVAKRRLVMTLLVIGTVTNYSSFGGPGHRLFQPVVAPEKLVTHRERGRAKQPARHRFFGLRFQPV